jgi:hypothetical protein
MNEPTRIVDSSSDELERALLHAGTSYSASPELREKTLAALGLTGAAAALGAGAVVSGSSAKLGTTSLLAKLSAAKLALLGVAASAALSVPFVMSGSSEAPPLQTTVVPPNQPRRPALAPPVTAPAAAEPVRSAAATPAHPTRTAAPAKPLSPAEALRVELGQLDAARSKLAAGRSEEALAVLDAYDRSAPRGMLKLEAEVLRIDALSRSGRTAQAQSRARAFLERHPKSVLAARVRRIAGQ